MVRKNNCYARLMYPAILSSQKEGSISAHTEKTKTWELYQEILLKELMIILKEKGNDPRKNSEQRKF